MSSSRVYAAASGQCLVRGADGVDEAERDIVQRDFHAGVRLVVDADRGEIRGVVPARRRSEELFYAVVRPDAEEPLAVETFHAAIAEMFTRRDRWTIRTDAPEGKPFRRFLENAERQGTTEERATANGTATDLTPDGFGGVVESIAPLLRKRTASDPPVTVGVPTFGEGLTLLNALRESGVDPAAADGAVVARTDRTDHLDSGLAVRIRDGEAEVTVLDHESRNLETDGTGDSDLSSDVRDDDAKTRDRDAKTAPPNETVRSSTTARIVTGSGLLGGVLLAAGGLARGVPMLAAVGVGTAAAALLLSRR